MKGCRTMKTLVCLLAVLVSAYSFAVGIPALPAADFSDTEVSTNFPFAVNESGGRQLVFSLGLDATTTNNVEVAIGCDADEDGLLSLDETALAVGYDCGAWFVRSAANDSVAYADVADSGTFRRVYEIRSRLVDLSWNLVKVTRRGWGVASESVGVELKQHGFGLTIQ